MSRETVFSPCRKYRYTLWREWGGLFDDVRPGEACNSAYVQFIGLNPSTADETKDDPTIRRCRSFATAWGYSAMCMTNLFAWRATDPADMKRESAPVGQDNQSWLLKIASSANVVVAAWGRSGSHMQMDLTVYQWLNQAGVTLHCLRKLCDGAPEHPLYLPKNLTPIEWRPGL